MKNTEATADNGKPSSETGVELSQLVKDLLPIIRSTLDQKLPAKIIPLLVNNSTKPLPYLLYQELCSGAERFITSINVHYYP